MRKIGKILALLTFGILLSFFNAIASQADTYDIMDYFPLINTDTWTFTNGPQTATNSITGTRVINGITTMRYHYQDGTEEYYTSDSSGYRNHGVYVYSPELSSWVYLPYDSPLNIAPQYISIGSTYNGSSSCNFLGYTIILNSTFTVNGPEDVVSLSGTTFKNAMKITWTLNSQCAEIEMNITETQEYWLYRNLGIVKQRVVSSGSIALINSGLTHYSSSRKKAELLASVDGAGYVYYEYFDESLSRPMKKQGVDGSYVVINSYWGSTATVMSEEACDPNGLLTAKRSYDSSGNLMQEITYYVSGNLESWHDSTWNATFIYEDLDYYNCADSYDGHGRGRVISTIEVNGDGETTTKTFEYYDDTLILKTEDVKTTDSGGNVIPDRTENYIYFNEDPWANPSISRDFGGNRYVSVLIPDESGSWKARVIKYNSSGAYQWAAEYDAGGSSANAINVVDANGNVYLAAKKYDGDGGHVVVYKFDASGNQVGAPYLSPVFGSSDTVPAYIKVDPSNNIFILGMTGNWPNNSLSLIKLNPDLTQQWVSTYTTGAGNNGDHGGYITFGSNGDIILHGAQHESDAFPEYYRVTYDADGNQKSVEPDPVGRCFNVWSPWSGREYKCVESDGTYYSLGFINGTETTLVDYTTDTEGFPDSFGGMAAFIYKNAANEDVGYRIEFDNNDVIAEALPIPGSDGGWLPTKFEGYDMDGHIGSTWWLFWDSGVAIEKTSSDEYLAYSFDTDVESLEEWEQSLAPAALPDPLPALPELGDWWDYCARNNVIPEFPPLSSDGFLYDEQGRVTHKVDHNDYLDTIYEYNWNGGCQVTASYDFDKDAVADRLVYKSRYNNNGDTDIAHILQWNLSQEITYYASGNVAAYYNGWDNGYQRYTFLDEDYYNYSIEGDPAHSHGLGRLCQYDYFGEGSTAVETREFEYYGDTLNVKKMTQPGWMDDEIVPGTQEETLFYNEEFVKNPRIAIDSDRNKIVSAFIMADDLSLKAYLVKYNSSGVVQWRSEVVTNTYSMNNVVAVDASGNIYLATTQWNGVSGNDVWVYKFSPAGAEIGSYKYACSTYSQLSYIIVDASGNVIVSGRTGDWPDTDLFIAKIDPNLDELWAKTYDSTFSDECGYLELDADGDIILHGNAWNQGETLGTHPEYYKVKFNSLDGTNQPAVYDELELNTGGSWLGIWNSGREYQDTEIQGGMPQIWRTLGYKHGTGLSIVGYNEGGVEYFPLSYGGMTAHAFIDLVTGKDIGVQCVFANGMEGEAVFGDSTEDFYATKMYGLPDDTSTYWFLWGEDVYDGYDNVVIKKTVDDQWTAYQFDNGAEMFEDLMQGWTEIGPVADPASLVLPELGDWEEYCALKNITVEYPPLSTDYNYDPLEPTRVIERVDRNDYNDVKYAYTWDPDHGKAAEKTYYGENLAVITHYINGSDFDIANKGTWGIENEITYYTSGNLRSYQTYYDGGNNRYVFEDSNYYNVDGGRGQGRLLRWEYTDGNGDTNFNEFEYYGDTLNLKKLTRAVWEDDNIVPGASSEEVFYNEEFIKNPRMATDSEGNTIVAALIIGDEYGNSKAYVVKYDSDSAVLWRKEFNTYNTAFNVVVAVGNDDNVYVAASTWNGTDCDTLIYGYTKGGDLIGSYQYDGGDEERITSIVTDSSGNVYIAGEKGEWETRDLFIAKLNPDLSNVLWDNVYNSGDKDSGGYLTIDGSGNIVLHGTNNSDFPFEYYKIEYDPNGAESPAVYDSLEMYFGSYWMGAWKTGREYKDNIGEDSGDWWYVHAYLQGTGKTLIDYGGAEDGFPVEFGNMMAYRFINQAGEDIGYRIEFDNNDVIVEAVPTPDDGWVPTKFEHYDFEGHVGSTWWLLWDINTSIEKTSGPNSQYFAYFLPDSENIDSLDEWKQSIITTTPITMPSPMPTLPELGPWWDYCARNNQIPEFPPLSSVYTRDVQNQNRVTRKVDHNDYLDTIYEYNWNYGLCQVTVSYDFDRDGTADRLVSNSRYNNRGDTDIAHILQWTLQQQITYYASGNVALYYNGWDNGYQRYTFQDEDYYNCRIEGDPTHSHGRGRLVKYENFNEGSAVVETREFEYYGDTLNLKRTIEPAWENNVIVPGGLDETLYYDETLSYKEELLKNPTVAIDSNGNKIASAAFIIDDDLNLGVYLAKYDSAGAVQWHKEVVTNNYSLNNVVAVDAAGDIYLETTKWNGSSGNDVWINKFRGSDGLDLGSYTYACSTYSQLSYIIVDLSGNVIVSGRTGDWPDTDLFIVKLDSNLGELWAKTYDSLFSDEGGYLELDADGNIILHGYAYNQGGTLGTHPKRYKVKFNSSDGNPGPAIYDELEFDFGNNWLGVWNNGREYQETETQGGTTRMEWKLGYRYGTRNSIVSYDEGGVGDKQLPESCGGMMGYSFIDPVTNKDIGARCVFANGAVVEVKFGEGGTSEAYNTKVYGLPDDTSTYWFLWGDDVYGANDNVVIKKTGDEWTAYPFNSTAATFEALMQFGTEIGPVADPGSLVLPELGDWRQYCIDNNILPEFPPLTSDCIYMQGRLTQRIDHNPFMDTTYTYEWDYEAEGHMKWTISFDDLHDGDIDLIVSQVYNNGTDYNPANMPNWRLLSTTNHLSGVTTAFYDNLANRMSSKTLVTPDAEGNTYYHYIDEDWQSRGFGRVDRQVRANPPDEDGALSYEYSYCGLGEHKVVTGNEILPEGAYNFSSLTVEAGASLTFTGDVTIYLGEEGLLVNGLLIFQGASTYLYCNYMDLFRGTGTIRNEGGTIVISAPTTTLYQKKCYGDTEFTNRIVTYTYYSSGRWWSKELTTPDPSGNNYYRYRDENWNNQGYGRIDKTKRQTALNGELSHTYTYHTGTNYINQKNAYSNSNWTTLVATYFLYNNSTNRMHIKNLTTPDSSGNIYYHYRDENWNTQGYGKIDKTKRQTALDGELSHTYTYYEGTDHIYQIKAYSDANWTNLVATYTYDEDGNQTLKEPFASVALLKGDKEVVDGVLSVTAGKSGQDKPKGNYTNSGDLATTSVTLNGITGTTGI